jgi:hypothetical protein
MQAGDQAATSPPALTRATEVSHGPGYRYYYGHSPADVSRTAAKSTSAVRLAHTELVAALAGNVPHPIYAEVDADDLDGRAEHLENLFALHV